MDTAKEEFYITMASENPNMRCSEAPVEILEAASYAGDEPTPFLTSFFTTGHSQWLARRYGHPASAFDEERIERAVLLLWVRACELYTSHLCGRPDSNWDQPFFSDEGLY
jgi:hypothetical protein